MGVVLSRGTGPCLASSTGFWVGRGFLWADSSGAQLSSIGLFDGDLGARDRGRGHQLPAVFDRAIAADAGAVRQLRHCFQIGFTPLKASRPLHTRHVMCSNTAHAYWQLIGAAFRCCDQSTGFRPGRVEGPSRVRELELRLICSRAKITNCLAESRYGFPQSTRRSIAPVRRPATPVPLFRFRAWGVLDQCDIHADLRPTAALVGHHAWMSHGIPMATAS